MTQKLLIDLSDRAEIQANDNVGDVDQNTTPMNFQDYELKHR